MGAWIETICYFFILRWRNRSLCGSVCWNCLVGLSRQQTLNCSLRGSVSWNLKYVSLECSAKNRSLRGSVNWNGKHINHTLSIFWSLPPWERELKPSLLKCFTAAIYYRFLHGSVSWNSDKTFKSETLSALMILRNSLVAPYVGACVERSIILLVRGNFLYVGLCVEINVQY